MAIVVAAFVLVVAVSAIISQTEWFRHWLRGQVEARLNEALLARVTIGHLDGRLVNPFGLRDLRITSDTGRVVAVRRALVRYDLLTLHLTFCLHTGFFRKRISCGEIESRDPFENPEAAAEVGRRHRQARARA